GLIISGENTEEVVFNFCDFENLAIPLKFDYSFFRKKVEINICTFKRNYNTSNFITVASPQLSIGDDSSYCNFTISRCMFNGNTGAINFEDFRLNNMQININDNVFINNTIPNTGVVYNYDENVLWGRADKYYDKFSLRMGNNSFRNNFMLNTDNLQFQQFVSFGVYGAADSVVISDNYFDAENYKSNLPYIYDYNVSYIAPKIRILNNRNQPASNIPAHIYKSTCKQPGNETEILPFDLDLKKGLSQVSLNSNSVIVLKNNTIRLSYVYEKDTSQTIIDTVMEITPQLSNQNTRLDFTVPNLGDSVVFKKSGYFVVKGIFDREGNELPEEILGYKYYLIYSALTREERKKRRFLLPDDSVINKPKIIPPLPPIFYSKPIEVGINVENASYIGTISGANFYNYNSFGFNVDVLLALKWNVSVGINVLINNLIHSKGDNISTNATNPAGLYFNTSILGFGLRIEKNFFNNRYYKTQNRTVQPSLFTGFEFLTFTPKATSIQGKEYKLNDLRNPDDTTFKPYATSTFAIPFGVKVKWQVNPKFSVVGYFAYHITFTDNLDDVSDESFPNQATYNDFLTSKGYTTPLEREAINKIVNPNQLNTNIYKTRSTKSAGKDSFLTYGVGIYFHL
ncbi:MAG: DUF6089 family protein, partial [Alphaproteobacteria bacterium]|nr:DUF6089 family protein [Alphaproteobacteria bacterium]